MAQYTKAQLISASNATYFTNTSGGISASAVRDLNDSWISSSVLLSGSNTFIGSQIISGNVDITGTITASLQTGYLFVGNSSGRTQAVATSSIIANTDTGSLLVTGSVSGNTLTFTKGDASTFNLTVATGSTPNTGSFLTTASFASTNITFTKGDASQFSLDGFATTGSNTFRGTQTIETGDLIMGNGFRINAPSGNITNLSSATTIQFITEPPAGPGGSNDIKFYNRVSGSGILFINEQSGAANGIYYEAGELDFNIAARSGSTGIVTFRSNVVAIDAASTPITASALRTTSGGINSAGALTASLQQGYAWVGNSSGVSTLVATSSFGTSIDTGSFATTGSNTFTGNQTISTAGNTILNLTASAGFQTNIEFQSENSNFRAYGDFRINNNGDAGGTGSIKMLTKSNFMEFAADQGFRYGVVNATSNGIEGGYVTINVPSGSQQFQLTGSLVVSNTLTASLAQGYAWVGNSSNVSTLVATSSFGGGSTSTGSLLVTASFDTTTRDITFTKGDATTFNLGAFATTGSNTSTRAFIGLQTFVASNTRIVLAADNGIAIGPTNGLNTDLATGAIRLLALSGSLILTNDSYTNTTASLSHLSSSNNTNLANFIFKPNNNVGSTIISGSSNIFTNPNIPTTGYTKYIGGNNNLYLNNSNGITSEITASAASVSGARPVMNNNIFNGNTGFTINQANNPGTHTLSHNIIANGGTTINALAFTGSLNFNSNFNNNGTITINAASQSIAQIATGLSGSGTFTMNGNGIFGGTITNTSPRTLLTTNTQTCNSNVVAGASITVTNISSSASVNVSSNITNGNILYTNASATGVHTSAGSISNCQGAITVNAIGSAVGIANGIFIGGPTITNNSFSGSVGGGLLSANRNLFQGQGHTLTITGSSDAGTSAGNFSDNAILGKTVTIFSNLTGAGNYRDLNGCVIGGQNLIVTGSNSFALTEGGSAHFGRYNANDGIRNKTGENVFSVGTGNSTTRKTGFLIDSGSNTFVEGTLNVSGSTALTGSLAVSSFTTLASVSSSLNFADDTAAAAGGVPLGGLYRNGNFVMIRLT